MNIIDKIRLRQALAAQPDRHTPPRHEPKMLYIGCVDARLDPIDDIGIEKGAALILRNIGALVPKDERMEGSPDRETILAGGQIPQNVGIGAALEFFLNHLPQPRAQPKHIVISGHTDCGGMKACQRGEFGEHDHHLALYLEGLREARARIGEEARANNWGPERVLRALEEASVRQSVSNLRTYPVVRQAVADGRAQIHGWIINTATQLISELNPETSEFEPMAGKSAAGPREAGQPPAPRSPD
jgi:carbonic anhydrase